MELTLVHNKLPDEATLRKWQAGAWDNHDYMYRLGRAHIIGDDPITKNEKLGVEHLEHACDMGHGEATLLLGHIYSSSIGGAPNYNKSFSKYRKAVRIGHPEARLHLYMFETTPENAWYRPKGKLKMIWVIED